MNECKICKKQIADGSEVCEECSKQANPDEKAIPEEKPTENLRELPDEPVIVFPDETNREAEDGSSVPPAEESSPEEPLPKEETAVEEELEIEFLPEEQPSELSEDKSDIEFYEEEPPVPIKRKRPSEKTFRLLRIAELAANPYPVLRKKTAPLWFLLLLPAVTYALGFVHIAWDKISLSYLPFGFLFLYLLAGIAAGLFFAAVDTGLTVGLSALFKTGRQGTLPNLAGAVCFPSAYTVLLAAAGLLFRLLFGWGSIVFVPISLLLPLCFLLPFWTRYYKGKQFPALATALLSGFARIAVAQIFLSMKF